MINHGHITWGTSPKTRFGAHLGPWGLPEAQTGQPRVGIKVALGKMEHFGIMFWYLGLTSPSSGSKIQNNSKTTVFYSKITVFEQKTVVFVFKKKAFFCSSSQSAHRHRHDEHIMLQTRSAASAPGANIPFQRL